MRTRVLIATILGLMVIFCVPLSELFRFAAGSDLYSHILIVPLVTIYLIWIKPKISIPSKPNLVIAAVLASIGIAGIASYWVASSSGLVLAVEDKLAWQVIAFVSLVAAACATFLGRSELLAISFPLSFLIFLAPFPVAAKQGIELFFQHTSASAAAGFLKLAGTPFFREGTFFQLPGINLEVAPECSGIRSSLALFITSLVAGHLFLKSKMKRLVLTCVVIPLAILRNGLRIFVIAQLCVRIGPEMIHSYIHRQGGPIFFAISLIPFSLLLYFLLKYDRRDRSAARQPNPSQ
jgi:exosortase C (VPDSG-CTERM-specific)